jgi:hypothetical protein
MTIAGQRNKNMPMEANACSRFIRHLRRVSYLL